MQKETMAEKLARKAFESGKVQQSWTVHMQAFGPILEPAFAGDYQTRVDLTAALNMISRRDLKGGLDKLKRIQTKCVTDADKAAWLFFMGVCMEMAGAKEQMISLYQQAGELGHRFYLPYLKVAKAAHGDMVLEVAEENYQTAIACLKEAPEDGQTHLILASAYTNLASCLTMMHRFDDAFDALEYSNQFVQRLPGRSGTAAIAAAAEGDWERAEESLENLRMEAPQMMEQVRDVVEKIRSGIHPHFFAQPIADEEISGFWSWFAEQEAVLSEKVSREDYEGAASMLQERLALLFPFAEKGIELALFPEDGYIRITMADFYAVGVNRGYQQLLNGCPDEMGERWKFTVVR